MSAPAKVFAVSVLLAVPLAVSEPASATLPAPNAYPIVLSGDFTGDDQDDLFFHSPDSSPDVLYNVNWRVGGSALDKQSFAVTGSYRPMVGDFTGDGVDDIFWYRPGVGADVIWDFNATDPFIPNASYTRRPVTVNGSYVPVAGDFTADRVADVFWYGPGAVADSIWDFRPSSTLTYRNVATKVSGTGYRPVAGHFMVEDQSGDDIFWYSTTGGTESLWDFLADDSLDPYKFSAGLQVRGTTYKIAVADLFHDGGDDLIFVGPGTTPDSAWDFYDGTGAGDTYLASWPAPEPPLTDNYTVAVGIDVMDSDPFLGNGDLFFVYNPAGTRGMRYNLVDGGDWSFTTTPFDPAPTT